MIRQNNMIVKTIEKLRALRAEKRVKNTEIAHYLGYSKNGHQYLSKIMNGLEYASKEQIQIIADAIIEIHKSKAA